MSDAIVQAIQELRVVEFGYEGGMRLVHPHAMLENKDTHQQYVQGFQVDGYSKSGNLPGWRNFHPEGIEAPVVLRTLFTPQTDAQEARASLDVARVVLAVEESSESQED